MSPKPELGKALIIGDPTPEDLERVEDFSRACFEVFHNESWKAEMIVSLLKSIVDGLVSALCADTDVCAGDDERTAVWKGVASQISRAALHAGQAAMTGADASKIVLPGELEE